MTTEIAYALLGVLFGLMLGLRFCYETVRGKYLRMTPRMLHPGLEITTICAVIFGLVGWIIGLLMTW
jgi:hypothetical protein